MRNQMNKHSIKKVRMLQSLFIGLFVAFVLLLITTWAAKRVKSSAILMESSVFHGIIKQDKLNIVAVLEDSEKRLAAERFAHALADAYINFELIPVNEGETFAYILKCWVDGLHIERFIYHGRDLTIIGSASTGVYHNFLENLEHSGYFREINIKQVAISHNMVYFEIECSAKVTSLDDFFNLEEF